MISFQASEGRTTLIVAHRLSSIRHANCIYYVNRGRITESGNHETLMAEQGDYYRLVQSHNDHKGQGDAKSTRGNKPHEEKRLSTTEADS